MDATKIEACARAAHEANRNYCYAIGDSSQPPWESAPDWQKRSAIQGVEGALAGNTPEQSHQGWLKVKEADGWVYGEKKDLEAKTHPCMVPFDQLPPAQRVKDTIFIETVRTMGRALGLLPLDADIRRRCSAETLYECYVEASGGLNFQGNPCPKWDELPAKIRGNWEAVASFVG